MKKTLEFRDLPTAGHPEEDYRASPGGKGTFRKEGRRGVSYYLSKVVDLTFDEAVARVTEELEKEG